MFDSSSMRNGVKKEKKKRKTYDLQQGARVSCHIFPPRSDFRRGLVNMMLPSLHDVVPPGRGGLVLALFRLVLYWSYRGFFTDPPHDGTGSIMR
jgi:hypothetical protein